MGLLPHSLDVEPRQLIPFFRPFRADSIFDVKQFHKCYQLLFFRGIAPPITSPSAISRTPTTSGLTCLADPGRCPGLIPRILISRLMLPPMDTVHPRAACPASAFLMLRTDSESALKASQCQDRVSIPEPISPPECSYSIECYSSIEFYYYMEFYSSMESYFFSMSSLSSMSQMPHIYIMPIARSYSP
jgi:hypothetical protein